MGKQDVSEVQEKHKVLNLGLNNPRAQNRLESAGWEEQLEGSWWTTSRVWSNSSNWGKQDPGLYPQGYCQRDGDVIILLNSVSGRPHLQYCVRFCLSSGQMQTDWTGCKGDDQRAAESALRGQLGLLPQEERAQEESHHSITVLEGWLQRGWRFSLP